MAITRVWQTGWELGDTAARAFEITVLGNSTSVGSPKTGTYCCILPGSAGTYQVHAALSQARMGIWVNHVVLSANIRDLLWFYSGEIAALRLRWDVANGRWLILCGATQVADGLDAGFARDSVYTHIGIDFKLHATTGWVYVYCNSTLVASYDGQTNQGAADFDRTGLGNIEATTWTGSVCDDVYLDNTSGEAAPAPPPALRFFPLLPTGSGYSSQFSGSDGDSVNNYALVDEIPPTTTDYVYDETAGHIDAYTLGDLALPANGIINAVIPVAYCLQEKAGGARAIKLGTRTGGANATGSAKTMTTGHTLQWERQTTKPGGGSWSDADVDGAEVVLEIS